MQITKILEALLLAATLSMDAFFASFGYGSNKIKIPLYSVTIICTICSGFLALSMLLGSWIRPFLSAKLAGAVCFAILFVIGIIKLLDSLTKSFIRKRNFVSKNVEFSISNLNFVLSIYADPTIADVDCSKTISPTEAVSLSTALSLDSLVVGFGAAVGNVNSLSLLICSFVITALAVICGTYIGERLCSKLKSDLSWISGAVLIILSFTKLI
ncbi:MAG: sporulation membrane protein YtaF [Oscillospiraceae bacterium]|nr:sporulation membrane protein YtaF [Oscillospiraceae bacterium]